MLAAIILSMTLAAGSAALADPNRGQKPGGRLVITEVFVDFLVRWGEEFKQLEPHHHAFLEELCDRTCAQFNGEAPEGFVPKEDSDEPIPKVRRLRLPDDIFKNVWMEVNEFYLTGKRQAEHELELHKPVGPIEGISVAMNFDAARQKGVQ